MLCQATQTEPATVRLEIEGSDIPYQLCAPAAERLQLFALRPLEWYRLALIHSPFEFYLHDDFYDEYGNACQPARAVQDAALWPFPLLDNVRGDLNQLFDYATAQFNLTPLVSEAIRALSQHEVAAEVARRFALESSWHHKGRMLEIADEVLGTSAANWIRDILEPLSPDEQWLVLRHTTKCIPSAEGYERSVALVPFVPLLRIHDACLPLSAYHDPRALDWIERQIASPVVGDWGFLAACSNVDWPRLAAWLRAGRPRSLAALDALWELVRAKRGEVLSTSPLKFAGKLDATADEIASELHSYAKVDDAPRAEQRVRFLLQHLRELTE